MRVLIIIIHPALCFMYPHILIFCAIRTAGWTELRARVLVTCEAGAPAASNTASLVKPLVKADKVWHQLELPVTLTQQCLACMYAGLNGWRRARRDITMRREHLLCCFFES